MDKIGRKIAFQPPKPPSYSEKTLKNIIWIPCQRSRKKHNLDPERETNEKKKEVIKKKLVLIPALFLKFPNTEKLILFSHGNATDLGQTLPFLQLLNQSLKINVFGYDYQGYGIAKPRERPCSEKRIYASVQACFDYILDVLKFKSENIIIFGCSLGSAASVYLASNQPFYQCQKLEEKRKRKKRKSLNLQPFKRKDAKKSPTEEKKKESIFDSKVSEEESPTTNLEDRKSTSNSLEPKTISEEDADESGDEEDKERLTLKSSSCQKRYEFRGVILQSAFTTALKTRIGVKNRIPFDLFENIKRAPYITSPVFLIHGEDDLIVPFKHSLELNKVLPHPYEKQLFIKFAGHNNILSILSVKVYVKKLREFLKYLDLKEIETPQKNKESKGLDSQNGKVDQK